MAVPNYKDRDAGILRERRSSHEPFFRVGATFTSRADEHYYGLGQNQEGTWSTAATRLTAGTITTPQAVRPHACRSW